MVSPDRWESRLIHSSMALNRLCSNGSIVPARHGWPTVEPVTTSATQSTWTRTTTTKVAVLSRWLGVGANQRESPRLEPDEGTGVPLHRPIRVEHARRSARLGRHQRRGHLRSVHPFPR